MSGMRLPHQVSHPRSVAVPMNTSPFAALAHRVAVSGRRPHPLSLSSTAQPVNATSPATTAAAVGVDKPDRQ
jgi:hypothetical protein